ncbi:MAG: penicillin-binding protein, partial [Burkholderia sp.]|nr:penicillin-binding protein [Burkholderia sp.]
SRMYRRIAGYFKSTVDPAEKRAVRVKSLIKAMIASGAIGAVLFVGYAIVLIPFTPSIADIRKAKAETPSILMSSDGKELALFKRMNREWVELDEISPHAVNALIATEDHRFYEHHGVDLKRTAAGILRTLQGDPEGGSTLTQQLARNLYPEEIGRKRTVTRKLKELITALKIEYAYSKQEILLTYLNTMPFLYNAFGIEMGARTYFDKPAAKLDVLESATLIGMLKGTSYYNPVLNGDRALKRRNVVLSQMAKRGVLSKPQFDKLKTRPMRLDFERQPEPIGSAPHFAAHVRKWLIDWADRNDYNLYSDGLVVYSTIDSRMQEFAEQAVYRQMQTQQAASDFEKGVSRVAYAGSSRRVQPVGAFWRTRGNLLDAFVRESAAYRAAAGTEPELALKQIKGNAEFMARLSADKTRLETGFVAVDPTNGHVKAWVGSRDFAVDQFDHVAQARRQPGSTFKPFVYGAALEEGMSAETRRTDAAVEITMDNGSIWRPTDASGPSGREMTLREALAYSKNTITAQVMQEVGARKVVSFARKLGVNQSTLDPVPALSLGTSPVTLLEMVSAYSTIAGGGEFHKPVMVNRIVDKEGKVLETFRSDSKRAISGKTAYDLTDMMRSVVDQGTGRAIRTQFGVRADVAGKTGTTQDNTDGWFILMHPRLVAGAWVGFNDARVTMRNGHWGEGSRTALPIVGDFYRRTSHTRLVDSSARFAPPPDSFFESLLGKVYGLFDQEKPEPPRAAPRQSPPSHTPTPHVEPDTRLNEMERITTQASEVEESYEDEHDSSEPTPANPVTAVEGGTP